jgi:hypothetical protein
MRSRLEASAMNLFRCTPDRSLDRKYLRVCSVYRLLKAGKVNKARALDLLADRHSPTEMKSLRGTVDLWLSGPLRRAA